VLTGTVFTCPASSVGGVRGAASWQDAIRRVPLHLSRRYVMRNGFLEMQLTKAGTVSGAPKVRAMELIAELEREKRGVYAGAVGYFGYGYVDGEKEIEGAMDVSVSPLWALQVLTLPDMYRATHHASQGWRRVSPSRGKLDEFLFSRRSLMIGQGGIVFDSDPHDEWMETINKLGVSISRNFMPRLAVD
jgi:hypothetical protein